MNGGRFLNGVLEFDDHQGETIHEQNDIGSFIDIVLDDGKLIDHQKLIVGGVLVVQQPNLIPHDSVTLTVFDIHPFGEVLVKGVVVLRKIWTIGTQNLLQCLILSIRWYILVEGCNGLSKAGFQDNLIILPFVCDTLRGNICTIHIGITQFNELLNDDLFDMVLGDYGRHYEAVLI